MCSDPTGHDKLNTLGTLSQILSRHVRGRERQPHVRQVPHCRPQRLRPLARSAA